MATTTDVIAYDPRFPDTDDVPLESPWHHDQISFLIELLESRFMGRNDFFVGGNMFIYYDETNARKSAGPDVFFVRGVERERRRNIWAVWQEQDRFPDLIIELMSPRTKNKDRKTNKDLYEQVFQTPEYFLYDPETHVLEGWRLIDGRYEPIQPNEAHGRLWSEQIECWLGLHQGEYLPGRSDLWVRLFDAKGKLIPSFRERADEREKRAQERVKRERSQRKETERQLAEQARQLEEEHRRAEEERKRAEEECKRAEEERERAQEEHRRADEARKRADAAEAELARLRALLKQSELDEPNDE